MKKIFDELLLTCRYGEKEMESINYAGSQWAKWDLHVHSNASDGKMTPEEIIHKAKDEGLEVLALTDHHTVKNIDEIKKLGKEHGITVISGIEFRTEYGSSSVHMIGLFPNNYNGIELTQSALADLILAPLNLSETIIVSKGLEAGAKTEESAFKKGMFMVQVAFKEAADLIHKYGGLVSVHAGDKANSIEEMKHEGKSKRNVQDVVDSLGTVKDELMDKYIDICELGSLSDKNAAFYIEKFSKPAILASDSHKLNKIGTLFTWIKSDKTFEGLKQILYEPELRVKIQQNRPEMKSDYQIIESLELNGDEFGHQEIPFNANLNTIIGGRSSGKSILLGCIAKLSNYSGEIKQGNDDYNVYIDKIVMGMRLRWKDNTEGLQHKVEYFPQSYINKLASDSKEIDFLIEDILKGDEERKRAYEAYNSENSKNLVEITNEIENFFKLQYNLKETEEEEKGIGDLRGIKKEIIKIENEIAEVKGKSAVKLSDIQEAKYSELRDEKIALQQLLQTLTNADLQLQNLSGIKILREINADVIGLPEEIKTEIISLYKELNESTQKEWEKIIGVARDNAKTKINNSLLRIQEIESDIDYLNGEKYYKENAAIEQLNTRLEVEKKKADAISLLLKKKAELIEEITKSKLSIFDKHRMYREFGIRLCEKVLLEKADLKISPNLKFNSESMKRYIESNLNGRNAFVREIIEFEYKNEESLFALINTIFERIVDEKLPLKGSKDKRQAIIELMTNNFFEVRYDVVYQGDTLQSMSEGKKAFVILRMLLDFDGNECPILIDQPEDDLDNRAIYNDLVKYIRNEKLERQIILVTHNPNIVVATDSEEIIVANQHGIHNENQDDVKFEYRSGAIENSYPLKKEQPILIGQGIREHVCDLLEGGDVAFKKRECKYGFQ